MWSNIRSDSEEKMKKHIIRTLEKAQKRMKDGRERLKEG